MALARGASARSLASPPSQRPLFSQGWKGERNAWRGRRPQALEGRLQARDRMVEPARQSQALDAGIYSSAALAPRRDRPLNREPHARLAAENWRRSSGGDRNRRPRVPDRQGAQGVRRRLGIADRLEAWTI